MTISSTTVRNSYSGDGSTTTFSYTFKIFQDSDIQVIIRSANGTETTKTITTHYTVTGAGNSGGGSVIFTSGNIPTSTQTVVLRRNIPQTQSIDYIANDPFPAESHEEGLDRATMAIQQLQEEVTRSLKLSKTNTMTSTEFTVGASDRANKILAFDTNGELSVTQELGTNRGSWSAGVTYNGRDIVKDGSNNNVYLCNTTHTSTGTTPISSNADVAKWDLIVDAASATNSANAAANHASNSSNFANNSSNSANTAANHSSNASNFANNASNSANSASTYLAGVAANASNSSNFANNSSNSANSAANHSSNASNFANNSSNSANASANHSANSSNFANNSSNSANSASASATTATTQAGYASSNAATATTQAGYATSNATAALGYSSNSSNFANNSSNFANTASNAANAANAARDAALTAADNFDDVYLGAKSSAPTLDNDGDPLTAGDLYYNTVSGTLQVYSGSAWQAAAVSTAGFATITGVETLTNKTLTSPNVLTSLTYSNQGEVRFAETTANGSNYVGFKAPSSLSADKIWTLPSADATTSGQALVSDASGVLSWATVAATYNDDSIQTNLALLGFKVAVNGSLVKYDLKDQTIDEFFDSSGIDTATSTNEVLNTSGSTKFYSGYLGTSSAATTSYTYTGSDSTISLSNGELINGTVKLWGASGGSDYPGSGKSGGGGGFISGTLNYLSDGTDIIVSVGQGGPVGTEGGAGGSGGGYSGLFLGSKTHANSIIIAGGGGGAGDANDAGQGGGSTSASGAGTNAGGGGTQSAGGTASGTSSVWNPTAGSALQGGIGGNSRPGKATTANAAYNGGGYQGSEPGGQVGGGGGGGGYYGGGGGNNSTNGAGGGGGSNYYNGSYISSVTNLGGNAQTATSAGTAQSNKPFSTVGDGGQSTTNHGGIYFDYTITSYAYNDMTLVSNSTTAQSVPTQADLILLIENQIGTATINTDIKGYVSRDGGTTYTQGTLIDEGSWGTNKKVLAFHDLSISSQPSGTSMKYKITTSNQSSSKLTNIHAVSLGWK